MKKTIVLYGRRNTAAMCLVYLVAKGYNVKVVSDDMNVLWMAEKLKVEVRRMEERGYFDMLLCVHGRHIFSYEELVQAPHVNIHPALEKYRGHNPIKSYIENKDIDGSVSSHYMVEEVDAGKVIHTEYFETPICHSYADFYNVAYPYYIKLLDKTLELMYA
jgi:methionyl-tRNA formyltransferase